MAAMLRCAEPRVSVTLYETDGGGPQDADRNKLDACVVARGRAPQTL